jgi:competence protein ComFC
MVAMQELLDYSTVYHSVYPKTPELMWVSNLFSATIRSFLNFLLPESCLGCGKSDVPLCETCIRKLPPPREYSEQAISLFDYRNDVVRKAIWALKYRHNKSMGEIFGNLLYDKMLEELGDEGMLHNFTNPLLIPIPLSKKRLRERGFNQSEVIAQKMSYRDRGETFTLKPSVLYRTRDTGSQVSIKDRIKRIENMKGCFAISNRNDIAGRNIILIDDVTTTGATLQEAKKALMDAGARRVIGFTIAH